MTLVLVFRSTCKFFKQIKKTLYFIILTIHWRIENLIVRKLEKEVSKYPKFQEQIQVILDRFLASESVRL